MPSLQQIEGDAQLEVPRAVGGNIKLLAADPVYAVAWRFIIDQLCGQRRLSFVPGLPEGRDTMIWREGRRFVGEWLMRIVETPIPEPEPEPEPPARSLTERGRRRRAREAQQTQG